jgi:hypothetical protein
MSATPHPRALALRAGLASGAAQIAAGVAMYLAGVYFSRWSMAVSLAVLLVCVAASIHAARPARFADALLTGAVVSVCTGVMYAIYNLVTITWLYPDFLGQMAAAWREASGDPRTVEAIRDTLSAPRVAIPNLVRLSLFGTVLSLPVALLATRRSTVPAKAPATSGDGSRPRTETNIVGPEGLRERRRTRFVSGATCFPSHPPFDL